MKQNINPYDPVQFKKEFESTDICRNVSEDFDNLWWDQQFIKSFDSITPRQMASGTNAGFSMTPFYYLRSLLEKNPNSIYDLGCGANLFKKYIPKIIGVDKSYSHTRPALAKPDWPGWRVYPDIEELVDKEYVRNHQIFFESVFSINSLHFRPLTDLRLVYEEFISMVAPGGRGFLSINIQRMIDHESISRPSVHLIDYESYVRSQLDNLPCKYLIFDVNLDILDNWLDGNVRLVFER
jgi:SAM-dependent methyltransferase